MPNALDKQSSYFQQIEIRNNYMKEIQGRLDREQATSLEASENFFSVILNPIGGHWVFRGEKGLNTRFVFEKPVTRWSFWLPLCGDWVGHKQEVGGPVGGCCNTPGKKWWCLNRMVAVGMERGEQIASEVFCVCSQAGLELVVGESLGVVVLVRKARWSTSGADTYSLHLSCTIPR